MSVFNREIVSMSTTVLENCRKRKWLLATAESCTGGLIGGALTDIAGSSDVFDRGFITYTNKAKHKVIGVDIDTLRTHGAVSEEVARAMAAGATTCRIPRDRPIRSARTPSSSTARAARHGSVR